MDEEEFHTFSSVEEAIEYCTNKLGGVYGQVKKGLRNVEEKSITLD